MQIFSKVYQHFLTNPYQDMGRSISSGQQGLFTRSFAPTGQQLKEKKYNKRSGTCRFASFSNKKIADAVSLTQ
jgi:hypothetical protein